jgi:hypothetical protein
MRCTLRLAIGLAVTIMVGAPVAASAQCRLCPNPTTQLQTSDGGGDIRLDVQTSLDFDRLVLLGGGTGAATLLPNGDRSASGAVATVSASAMVGSVSVHGEPNRMLRVEMPARIDLYSLSGGRISIEQLQTDLPGMPRLDSNGNLTFRFGGRLNISGDADGDYRGDVPITVEYF